MSERACVKCGRALGLVDGQLTACARCRIRLRHAARDIETTIETLARLEKAGIVEGRIVEELRTLVAYLQELGADSCRAR